MQKMKSEPQYARFKFPILVLGYDFEGTKDEDIEGLLAIYEVHKKFRKPFTLFVLGKILDVPMVSNLLKELLQRDSKYKLMDVQQHGYSHVVFKKHAIANGCLDLSEVKEEVLRTSSLISMHFEKLCIGVRPPQGHYRGFQGDGDLLAVLDSCGIRYISSDLRGKEDRFPSSWKDNSGNYRQPYYYIIEGFPEMLEIPTHGWSDNYLYGMSKYVKTEERSKDDVLNYYLEHLDLAVRNNLVFAPLFHPWVCGTKDSKAWVLEGLVSSAIERNVLVLNYTQLYEECRRRCNERDP